MMNSEQKMQDCTIQLTWMTLPLINNKHMRLIETENSTWDTGCTNTLPLNSMKIILDALNNSTENIKKIV